MLLFARTTGGAGNFLVYMSPATLNAPGGCTKHPIPAALHTRGEGQYKARYLLTSLVPASCGGIALTCFNIAWLLIIGEAMVCPSPCESGRKVTAR